MSVCCFCEKEGADHGDLIIKPKIGLYIERHYHLKCFKLQFQNKVDKFRDKIRNQMIELNREVLKDGCILYSCNES